MSTRRPDYTFRGPVDVFVMQEYKPTLGDGTHYRMFGSCWVAWKPAAWDSPLKHLRWAIRQLRFALIHAITGKDEY